MMIRPPSSAMAANIGYRQRQVSDTWHVCHNCTNWPRFAYLEQWVLPNSGRMCDECVESLREGRCPSNILSSYPEAVLFVPDDWPLRASHQAGFAYSRY